jgi:hypothetical protein
MKGTTSDKLTESRMSQRLLTSSPTMNCLILSLALE